MKRKYFLVILFLILAMFLAGCGDSSGGKYAPPEQKKEYILDSNLKYNSFEDKWEYASPGSTLKYNVFEDKWEFSTPEESVKYNAFENKWEYAPSGSVLKYNPFADSWSYE
ncbi:hypothetical protein ES705_27957 [subsurface metagenome]